MPHGIFNVEINFKKCSVHAYEHAEIHCISCVI